MLRRLRDVFSSDLALWSRWRFLRELGLRRLGLEADSQERLTYYRLKGGGRVGVRRGTTDFKVLDEIFVQQVYSRFVGLLPRGGTIVDLGANVGLSTAYLCRIALESQVIAVEPDSGNFQMLLENLNTAGIEHRVRAFGAFAGAEPGFAAIQDPGNGAWGFRRGKRADTGVPVVSIRALVEGPSQAGPVSLKCDIEGDERELFAHLEEWEHLVKLIILELHTEFFPPGVLFEALRGSNFEWTLHGEIRPDSCIALIALEKKANRRSETSAGLTPLYGESTYLS